MLKHSSLQDFIDDLTKRGRDFPLKVMGEKRPNAYFSATMLAEIYSETENPDRSANAFAAAPFGEIHRRGASLDPTGTFSRIVAPSTGDNLFQGDVIDLAQSAPAPVRYWMIASHSCDIAKATVLACPVLLESDIDHRRLTDIMGKAVQAAQAPSIRANWLRNELVLYVAFPAPAADPTIGEPFVALLNYAAALPKSRLPAAPVLRLTYRALSFLQWRLAVALMRDVQNSDETRDF